MKTAKSESAMGKPILRWQQGATNERDMINLDGWISLKPSRRFGFRWTSGRVGHRPTFDATPVVARGLLLAEKTARKQRKVRLLLRRRAGMPAPIIIAWKMRMPPSYQPTPSESEGIHPARF
jgi:hypothetical protein